MGETVVLAELSVVESYLGENFSCHVRSNEWEEQQIQSYMDSSQALSDHLGTATVPNGRLWAYLVNSWDKVTPRCIREYQKIHLQTLGVNTKTDQINRLQEELMEWYTENEGDSASQKDFSVLNYFSMIHSEGPSQSILELVFQIMGREEYKGAFLSLKDNDFADEDSFDDDMLDDDDDSDADYEDTEPVTDGQEMQVVKTVLRGRTVDKMVPIEGFSHHLQVPIQMRTILEAHLKRLIYRIPITFGQLLIQWICLLICMG
ncbi:hypothetical protein BGZ54_007993 [Gamsiella multidivaricata]|nr:hypothetical protein BGZ54_007993 [Gamsiella multidivaricata]